MDSSDEPEVIDLAEPSSPSEPPAVSQDDDPDLPLEEPFTTMEPILPLQPAMPGVYSCEAESPGIHPVLGQIVHGDNDFTGMTHPDGLMAIAALVQAAVLQGPKG